MAAKQGNVSPDEEQTRLALMSVQALLVESEFLEELMRYRLSQPPGTPLPSHFRAKMLAALQKSVDDFLTRRQP